MTEADYGQNIILLVAVLCLLVFGLWPAILLLALWRVEK